jgi:hypothetical protein
MTKPIKKDLSCLSKRLFPVGFFYYQAGPEFFRRLAEKMMKWIPQKWPSSWL